VSVSDTDTHTHTHTHTHSHRYNHRHRHSVLVGCRCPCMGCLGLAGSLELYVSFAKEPYERDDILQKRLLILRSPRIVANPYQHTHRHTQRQRHSHRFYGVATISRLLRIIGLFCKRAVWKRRYSAKETYNFKEPNNRSHPIPTHTQTHSETKTQSQVLWGGYM